MDHRRTGCEGFGCGIINFAAHQAPLSLLKSPATDTVPLSNRAAEWKMRVVELPRTVWRLRLAAPIGALDARQTSPRRNGKPPKRAARMCKSRGLGQIPGCNQELAAAHIIQKAGFAYASSSISHPIHRWLSMTRVSAAYRLTPLRAIRR